MSSTELKKTKTWKKKKKKKKKKKLRKKTSEKNTMKLYRKQIIFHLFQQHRFNIALLDVPFVVDDELTSLFGSILSTIIDKQSRLDTVDVV